MTKEQEEAIEYVQKQIDYYKEQIKFIEAVDSDYYDEEYELYKNRVKQFETVLSMLKEKDKKIEYYKKQKDYDMQFRHELLEQIRCLNLDKGHNSAEIEKKNTELAEKNAEIEKKDKIIDLMAEQIKIPELTMKIESFDIKPKTKFGTRYLNKEEVKQYFERKATKMSQKGRKNVKKR